ncbi:hypothetical protein LEP1GSC170_3918 [Leptospira interrogans serovar Bataviae str. HAI135]|nr:hypothetical protein LEP1GSC170_3918 [Leptospira interrogans serovar Bataviae str. HAI135]
MPQPISEYTYYDAMGLAALVRKKSVHPIELVESAIQRIESINPGINAVITRFYEEAKKLQSPNFQRVLLEEFLFL